MFLGWAGTEPHLSIIGMRFPGWSSPLSCLSAFFLLPGLHAWEMTAKDNHMLSLIVSMFPFLLPIFLGVFLVGGLWLHDRTYRRHELNAGKQSRLP